MVRRELFRKIAKKYPYILLNAERPNMDTGIWDALYLDSLYTLTETKKVNSDDMRWFSRMRHYYHFVLSSMDEVSVIEHAEENLDYLMLSRLAIASNYLFQANENGYGALGPNDSLKNIQTIRKWTDWAREHEELMQNCFFLPDWPGQGNCDGYVRVSNGEGYAFFFNSNQKSASGGLPLDESVGLISDRNCKITIEYSTDNTVTSITEYENEVSFILPERVAILLKIDSV